jgi:hypothetical protein
VVGPWYEFFDANGYGLCQPDFILYYHDEIICIECKLTWKIEAYDQLLQYRIVLEFDYRRPVRSLLVCKNLTTDSPQDRAYYSLEEALKATGKDRVPIWHYLGRGGL